MSSGPTSSMLEAVQIETQTSPPVTAPAFQWTTLRLRLRPSRQLAWLLGAGHAAAGSVCWVAPIAWWLSLGLSLTVAASLALSLRQVTRGWSGVELRPDGTAAVLDGQGRWSEARILESSFVSPALTILNLAMAEARLPRSLVVAPDALPAEELRRLRVWLRWRAARAEVAQADNQTDT
jgi:toxin CptA